MATGEFLDVPIQALRADLVEGALVRPPLSSPRSTKLSHLSTEAWAYQGSMTLEELLADLPTVCASGAKRNAPGYEEGWNGCKLLIDAIDGGIPVSCLLTSASLHDSQAAIPLARLTAGRVDNLYDLMDSAYDAAEIRACSERLGHVPIIAPNPRRDAEKKAALKREALARRSIGQLTPQARRHRERSTVERVNGRLKDEFGGRQVRCAATPRCSATGCSASSR